MNFGRARKIKQCLCVMRPDVVLFDAMKSRGARIIRHYNKF